MKMSLLQAIEESLNLHLLFTGKTVTTTTQKKRVVILRLAKPMPYLRGSQDIEITNEDGTIQSIPVGLPDVREVRVFQDDISDKFQWDPETNTGEYIGNDLVLDVSKSQAQAWLKPVSFATSGRQFRQSRAADRFKAMAAVTDTTPEGNRIAI